jgi:hypothetical protein
MRSLPGRCFDLTVAAGSLVSLGACWESPVKHPACRPAPPTGTASLCTASLSEQASDFLPERVEVPGVRSPTLAVRIPGVAAECWVFGLAADRRTCYSWRRRPRLVVVGRLFSCLAGGTGLIGTTSIRETAMAYSPPSSAAEPQPKSDPGDAGRNLMGLLSHHGGLCWRPGTEADPAASSTATPAGLWATPRRRPGRHPILTPLLDNRTVVTRHQVGRQSARPTMASSHTARCAAAGRRSGTRAPDPRGARPDS